MKKIVAFIGVIGSGKDHNSKIQKAENPESKILAFSEGLREFCWNILKWRPKDEEEYELFKKEFVLDFYSPNDNPKPPQITLTTQMTGRQFMESVADQMRRYDPEFWGKYWLQSAKRELATTDLLIVPDCRHDEEAEKIMTLSGHLGIPYEFYFCNYKSKRYEIRDHSSEKFAQFILAQGVEDGDFINGLVRDILRKV